MVTLLLFQFILNISLKNAEKILRLQIAKQTSCSVYAEIVPDFYKLSF